LAALARRMDPTRMTNVVLPGRVGYAGSASVVYLTQDAPRLFADLRDDAVIGTAAGGPPPTSAPPTTTTPAPPPPADEGSTTTTRPPADATTTTSARPLVSIPG
jgi:hypothetical protein